MKPDVWRSPGLFLLAEAKKLWSQNVVRFHYFLKVLKSTKDERFYIRTLFSLVISYRMRLITRSWEREMLDARKTFKSAVKTFATNQTTVALHHFPNSTFYLTTQKCHKFHQVYSFEVNGHF